jgi:hypothetical protein
MKPMIVVPTYDEAGPDFVIWSRSECGGASVGWGPLGKVLSRSGSAYAGSFSAARSAI